MSMVETQVSAKRVWMRRFDVTCRLRIGVFDCVSESPYRSDYHFVEALE